MQMTELVLFVAVALLCYFRLIDIVTFGNKLIYRTWQYGFSWGQA